MATGTVTTYESVSNTDPTTSVGNVTLSATSSWYNTAWKYRRKVTFDNTTATLGVTSEALTNFPVLIKLDSTRIDYANTQNAGQDLRFTDSDGTTLLSYEIEKWDETGSSYVWVKVPSIDINSNTDNIYVYYGNTATADAQAATSVWDSNFSAVWHLKESSGATVADSTSNGKNGIATGTSIITTGQVGNARSFSGNTNYVSTTLSNGATVTISAWSTHTGDSDIMWNRLSGAGPDLFLYNGKISLNTWDSDGNPFCNTPASHNDGSYHQYVAIISSANTRLYYDGALCGTATYKDPTGTTFNISSNAGYDWHGNIDEMRVSTSVRTAGWVAAEYKSETDAYNTYASQEERYASSGTLTSNIFDAGSGHDWSTLSYTYTGSGTVTLKARSSNAVDMSGATAFSSCSAITPDANMSTGGCVTNNQRYLQYQIALTSSATNTPTFSDITLNMTPSDTTAPTTNASAIAMTKSNGGTSVSSNGWTNGSSPYFSWTAGADNPGGSGLKGYCLYLGTDSAGDPTTSKGLLGTSPVSTTGSTCQFIVSGTSVDLATSGYIGTALSTSSSAYYLNAKSIDLGNNVFAGSSTQFQFRFDNTDPTNVSYISCASGNFSNVADMNFSWPTTGSAAATDDNSDISGWQYQINSTAGTWNSLTTGSSYTLTSGTDGSAIVSGNNIIYFRSVDTAGNISSDSTIRTCNLAYGGAAPAFGGTDTVTITPATSTSNSFALSWPVATATVGQTVTHYYYMVNTSPPSTLATLQGNSSTYVDNGTTRTVAASALSNVNKGTNTVYVVAIDNAGTPNYSPSNYISGTFTLNSTDPDNVGSLVASDSSIKSSSQWNVTLTWVAPTYQGAGNLTYLIKRSTDNSTFTQVGTASGLSYVDNAPSSALYYYKVYTKDGADAQSSGTNAVSITPTGKWTSAPTLDTGPTAGSITTKKSTITWSTSRTSDSKIQYGTTSGGSYGDVEPSNSSQVTSHSVQLTGLNPGTTYYYKAKWTDEDGNTGTSDEKSFTTAASPTVKDVSAKSIGLSSATIQYTSSNASKVKIYYGTTTSFGGVKEVSTSTSETTYTTELSGLTDGTKYYYKINTFDSESSEYEGTILDFTTLPRPRISAVKIQEVKGTAQPTMLVSWKTNTEVSSIITYYPEGKAADARDEVNITLTKGEHKMFIKGLFPQTNYILVVKGRDKIGNEAVSDSQKVTTSTDTRPPQILNVKIEGGVIPVVGSPGQESSAQLVVSWDTDEPSTSQVEFGEGTGETYSQKTQEDSNLTNNHLVVISNLTPSKVYHLRAMAKDKASNIGKSIDSVTITPKSTQSALDLVVGNLSDVFGFLK